MSIFTVPSSFVQRYGRMDVAFLEAAWAADGRVNELAASMSKEEAQAHLQQFPFELLKQAGRPMFTGSKEPGKEAVVRSVNTFPFLALALVEKSAPDYFLEVEQQREVLSQKAIDTALALSKLRAAPKAPKP